MTHHRATSTPFLGECGTDVRKSDDLLTSIASRISCLACKRAAVGRRVQIRSDYCKRGHPIFGANVGVNKANAARYCKECHRARNRIYQREKVRGKR